MGHERDFPNRIAFLGAGQMLLALYCILAVRAIYKITVEHYGHSSGNDFALWIKLYGSVLLLLPVGWSIWMLMRHYRHDLDLEEGSLLLTTGLFLLGFLSLIAVFGTMSAMATPVLISSE